MNYDTFVWTHSKNSRWRHPRWPPVHAQIMVSKSPLYVLRPIIAGKGSVAFLEKGTNVHKQPFIRDLTCFNWLSKKWPNTGPNSVANSFRKLGRRSLGPKALDGFHSLWSFISLVTTISFKWAATWENRIFAYAKTKLQISFAVTAKLISAFVFATWIVQSLCFLNPKGALTIAVCKCLWFLEKIKVSQLFFYAQFTFSVSSTLW